MNINPSKLSGLLAATYVAVVLGGIFIHFLNTGDIYTLLYSLTLPATLISTILGAVVAFGLWREHSWGWWLGLTVGALQLFRFGHVVLARLKDDSVPVSAWLVGFLLLAFLVSLLTPAFRESCCRRLLRTPASGMTSDDRAEPVAPHEPPPRVSVSDAPDRGMQRSPPAPRSHSGR